MVEIDRKMEIGDLKFGPSQKDAWLIAFGRRFAFNPQHFIRNGNRAGRLKAFIRSRIKPGYRDRLDVEEILQDTLVRAFQSIASFEVIPFSSKLKAFVVKTQRQE